MNGFESLHRVIDRLLFLAKAESGALSPTQRSVDMQAFISSFAEDAEVLAEDRGARFVVTKNERGEMNAEPELLRQLLLNVVSNAVAGSAPGNVVNLDSQLTGEGWRLVVTDEGPGIPEADLARISTRFFQVAQGGATLARKGHGLGLAICRSIAEMHHGSLRVENRRDRSGLQVTVSLGTGEVLG